MERQYSHLTWKNRLKIRRMLDERRKPKEIADALHVHTSTIYREIKRGQTWQMTSEWEYVQKYCPETAERKYRENLQAKGPDLKIGNDHALASYLEEKIGKEHYSPAAALAKIKEEGRIFSVEISEWTLYSYIDKGVFATITNKSLPTGKKKKHPYRKVQEARLQAHAGAVPGKGATTAPGAGAYTAVPLDAGCANGRRRSRARGFQGRRESL